MKKWLLRGGVSLLSLASLTAIALIVGVQLGDRKARRQVALNLSPVTLNATPEAVERGRYLFMSRGCTECHGVNGGGHEVINDGKGMWVRAPNLTAGANGVVGAYTADDWARSVRHGVAPSGRPLLIMPSEDYARWTDADLNALVAYVKQMPAVDGEAAVLQLPALVKALYGVGVVQDAAEKIDHTLPAPPPVPEAATVLHGAYVAQSCIGCHGAGLSGGKIPGAPPDWPAAANLTPGDGSAMVAYASAEAFASTMRTGLRPNGSQVSKVMPFLSLKEMSDTDLHAVYLHLKGLPPRAAGQR